MYQALAGVALHFNTNGIPGISEFNNLLGGIGTLCEILALAGLVISAGVWAVSHHVGNFQTMSYGKKGVLVSSVSAFLIGGAAPIINFLIGAGGRL